MLISNTNKNIYAIDGLFLTQKITGIQRYAYEIVAELDKIIDNNRIEIVIPQVVKETPEYHNIKVIRYGKSEGIKWEQVDYCSYLRNNRRLAICLCNVIPLHYAHGIATIHDISCKVNPQFFASARDRASALWHRINYAAIEKSDMRIVTVSNFSKNEIADVYGVDRSRITVINPAWQHMNRINVSVDALEKYKLIPQKYYLAMATMMPNKNYKWILETARIHPNETFAVAGLNKNGTTQDQPNVKLLGYVSDADAKTLMSNCKAFIMPTFYEGFGLPPLEAAACGAKNIIVSDLPVLHEVYGENAEYINPHKAGEMPDDNVAPNMQGLLDRYSWKKSAKELTQLLG